VSFIHDLFNGAFDCLDEAFVAVNDIIK